MLAGHSSAWVFLRKKRRSTKASMRRLKGSNRVARLARTARSGGDGLAGGGKVARGGALLRAWFR